MNKRSVAAIKETVSSAGWGEIKKLTFAQAQSALITLADVKRPAQPTDDVLRGHISGLNWVLDFEKRVNQALAIEAAELKEQEEVETLGVGSPMEPQLEPTED